MSTQFPILVTGTLLAIPLSNYAQCGPVEADHDVAPVARNLEDPTQHLEALGKQIFYDKISVPKRMACVTCHDPVAGWTLKNAGVNLHQVAVTGADPHTAGALKPPANAYASKIEEYNDCGLPVAGFCGGNFWDGRAEGVAGSLNPGATAHVGDEVFVNADALKPLYEEFLGPTADQALNPFSNPVEQNIEVKKVCEHVAASKYAPLFELAWGEPIDCSEVIYAGTAFKAVDITFRRFAVALAAWQASDEVNPFDARRDLALANDEDGLFPLDDLTEQENRGHDLFYSTFFSQITSDGKFANCAFCHSDRPFIDDGAEPEQLYADDAFHNIGVPANPEIPGFPDKQPGLGGHTGDPGHVGLFKTPTMRNIDKRPSKGFIKAYTHNGWFKSLESLVHFYNTANVNGDTAAGFGISRCDEGKVWTEKEALAANCWPVQEHANGSAIDIGLIGDLGLDADDEAAIVAYLKTLSDTSTPKPPAPFKAPKL